MRFAYAAISAALFASVLAAPAFALEDPITVPASIKAIIADQHRPAADRARDADRKPGEMMTYAGIKPGMKIAELIPGGGYVTRLLSKIVGPTGHVYAVLLPNMPAAMKDQIKAVTSDPVYSNVTVLETTLNDFKAPEPLDVVWTSQNYHDFHNTGLLGAQPIRMDKSIYYALKPTGLFVVIDHVAQVGSGMRDTQTLHRIDPELTKAEVLAAGFVTEGQGYSLLNVNDPHTAKSDDKSDKFFLKFRKNRN